MSFGRSGTTGSGAVRRSGVVLVTMITALVMVSAGCSDDPKIARTR